MWQDCRRSHIEVLPSSLTQLSQAEAIGSQPRSYSCRSRILVGLVKWIGPLFSFALALGKLTLTFLVRFGSLLFRDLMGLVGLMSHMRVIVTPKKKSIRRVLVLFM